MRRISKGITLKEDTIRDIESGNLDTDLFIDRINGYISKANYLINTKMDNMGDVELLESLEDIFDIYYDPKDYLRMLSLKYGHHYLGFIIILTDMYDKNDNHNISYLGAVTSKAKNLDGVKLDIKTLRRLTNSGDIVLVQKIMSKEINPVIKEDYEDFFVDEIDINRGRVDKQSDLYPYAATVVKKETITKYVLFDLKQYIAEVNHQAKEIMDLSKSKDENISSIGKDFKDAYERKANNGALIKGERLSVKYHQKSNRKRRGQKRG